MSEARVEPQSPFPNTNWSMVARADDVRSSVRRRALEALLKQYLPALRAYLVARGRVRPQDVDDLLQGFMASKVLEQEILRRADQARGKFRSFLMSALERFSVSEFRKQRAGKRSPGEGARGEDAASETEDPGPDAAARFDLEWARQVVGLALERMRKECDAGGRQDVWGVFEGRVVRTTLDGMEPEPYEGLVERFGLESLERANNVLVTGKRMFARHLREIVGEYAEDADDADEEIRRLKQIVARDGAR
jgi:RNA polymerase sigma-70 factor (ECF subfamily)